MIFNEPGVQAYLGILIFALVLAFWQRKTFPFGESLAVLLIVGIGFTLFVYILVPGPRITPPLPRLPSGEIYFVLVYVMVVAALLARNRPVPAGWKGQFVKEKLAALVFKISVFVLIPFGVLYFIWDHSLADLGFSLGDSASQLRTALLLVLVFGGFNLIAGSGAAPLRARQFSLRQVVIGFSITFFWAVIEIGLVEEFFFRAFIQARLVGLLGDVASGVCAASLLFGLAHVPGLYLRAADRGGPLGEKPSLLNAVLYSIVVLSPTGWFMGLLFYRTQSLLVPVLVHAGMDAVAQTAEFIRGLKI